MWHSLIFLLCKQIINFIKFYKIVGYYVSHFRAECHLQLLETSIRQLNSSGLVTILNAFHQIRPDLSDHYNMSLSFIKLLIDVFTLNYFIVCMSEVQFYCLNKFVFTFDFAFSLTSTRFEIHWNFIPHNVIVNQYILVVHSTVQWQLLLECEESVLRVASS